MKTSVLGLAIPFHRNFDEVNLRFYVRRSEAGEVRRGVVFIREVVPRRAVAALARALYNERYVALPMGHRIEDRPGPGRSVEYSWRGNRGWNRLRLETCGAPEPAQPGSEEQFITEHYWGYSARREGGTVEYQVQHPSWQVWRSRGASFEGDGSELYGPALAAVLRGRPSSAFLAEGSGVTVSRGRRICNP